MIWNTCSVGTVRREGGESDKILLVWKYVCMKVWVHERRVDKSIMERTGSYSCANTHDQ